MLILTQAILLFCLTCTPALADFSGPVVSVLDGDTIEVRHPQATYDKIKDQAIANKSRARGDHGCYQEKPGRTGNLRVAKN